jgi:hypothetical protein
MRDRKTKKISIRVAPDGWTDGSQSPAIQQLLRDDETVPCLGAVVALLGRSQLDRPPALAGLASSSTSSARERKTKTKRTNDDNGLEIKPMDSALRVQVMAFKNNQKFSSIVFLGAMATGNWIT